MNGQKKIASEEAYKFNLIAVYQKTANFPQFLRHLTKNKKKIH